jgi:hypothetical protein
VEANGKFHAMAVFVVRKDPGYAELMDEFILVYFCGVKYKGKVVPVLN